MQTRDEDFVSRLFVASTHTPVLFFTSSGQAYKLKVWRLPLGTPQSRGRAIINLLPNIAPGEGISAILPLPEDEASWADLTVMFATAKGYVRRNSLGDFANVMANGKIAMKFEGEDADDSLIGVGSCNDQQDVLLATRNGKCIRFSVTDVRVFTGRSSTGVRGIKLLGDDQVIAMSILEHLEVEPAERDAYFKRRRASGAESDAPLEATVTDAAVDDEELPEGSELAKIDDARFAELEAHEEFLLRVTSKGFGVRTSAYHFRLTNRGGQGVTNMNLEKRDDAVVAVFAVQDSDEIVLVTNQGQVIRCPVHDIRITGRGTVGVVVFRVTGDERVVSVATLRDTGENGEAGEGENGEDTPDGPDGGAVPPDSTVH
jgi:DNA gyrase subunit A